MLLVRKSQLAEGKGIRARKRCCKRSIDSKKESGIVKAKVQCKASFGVLLRARRGVQRKGLDARGASESMGWERKKRVEWLARV